MSFPTVVNLRSTAKKPRIAGIEGLRGVAAFLVLAAHVGSEMAPLSTGPEETLAPLGLMRHGLSLFFALSGFLLFLPYVKSILTGSTFPSTRKYAVNRLLRIYPAYLVVLLAASYLLQATRRSDSRGASGWESSGFLPVGDALLALSGFQTLVPSGMQVGLGVAWSLTVELTFYIALPLLAALAVRLAWRSIRPVVRALVPVAVLFAVGFGTKVWFFLATRGMGTDELREFEWGQNWGAVVNRSILHHADLFAYGMAAAIAYVLVDRGLIGRRAGSHVRWAAVTAMVAGVLVLIDNRPALGDMGAGVASAALILMTALLRADGADTRWSGIMESPLPRWAGLVSFSAYLWHIPVIWTLLRHGLTFPDSPAGLLGNIAVVAVLTYGLSTVTYLLVEKPALQLKDRFTSSQAQNRLP